MNQDEVFDASTVAHQCAEGAHQMSLVIIDRCSLPFYSESRLCRVWEDRVFPKEMGQVYKTRTSVSGRNLL